jgi:hypothetical protein
MNYQNILQIVKITLTDWCCEATSGRRTVVQSPQTSSKQPGPSNSPAREPASGKRPTANNLYLCKLKAAITSRGDRRTFVLVL